MHSCILLWLAFFVLDLAIAPCMPVVVFNRARGLSIVRCMPRMQQAASEVHAAIRVRSGASFGYAANRMPGQAYGAATGVRAVIIVRALADGCD